MSNNSDRIFGVGNSTGTIPMNTLTAGMGLWNTFSVIDKFGKNEDVDTAYEDIWVAGGTMTLLTSASTLTIDSTAPDDDGDTGANTIEIEGLDADYAVQTEAVTLDATTSPVTTTTWLRVYRVRVTSAGSGGVNAAAITITATTGGSTQALILAGEGQTQQAIYTIPAGMTGYLDSVFISTDSSNIITTQLQVRPFGEAWQVKRELKFTQGLFSGDLSGSGSIPEKSDIKVRALANNPNNIVSAGFKIILKTS